MIFWIVLYFVVLIVSRLYFTIVEGPFNPSDNFEKILMIMMFVFWPVVLAGIAIGMLLCPLAIFSKYTIYLDPGFYVEKYNFHREEQKRNAPDSEMLKALE